MGYLMGAGMTNKISVDALIGILDSYPDGAFVIVSGGTASSASLDAWVEDDDKFVSLGTIIYSSGEWDD